MPSPRPPRRRTRSIHRVVSSLLCLLIVPASAVAVEAVLANANFAAPDTKIAQSSSGHVVTIFTPDLIIDHLEITQSIQDLSNSVPLVAGKRTVVRAHVHSHSQLDDIVAVNPAGSIAARVAIPAETPSVGVVKATGTTASAVGSGIPGVLGQFFVRRLDQPNITYGPFPAGNTNGRISVKKNPDRANLNDSFFFEIPQNLLHATDAQTHVDIEVRFVINGDHAVTELNPQNDEMTVTGRFIRSQTFQLKIFLVDYKDKDGNSIVTPIAHAMKLISWLRRAYPIPDVTYDIHTFCWPLDQTPQEVHESGINDQIAQIRQMDGSPANTYALAGR